MRSFILTLALGVSSLGLLCLTPQQSEARWRFNRGYYGYYYSPYAYSYPAYSYWRPAYSYYYPAPMYYGYSTPYSSYYSAPMYGQSYPMYGQSYSAPSSGSYYAPSYAPSQAATTVAVGAYDDRFEPPSLNILPGTTVRWTNYGRMTHTVTADDGSWDSGNLPPGAIYTATFSSPGTYYYHCRYHANEGMRGTIVVGSGGGQAGSGY